MSLLMCLVNAFFFPFDPFNYMFIKPTQSAADEEKQLTVHKVNLIFPHFWIVF